MKLEILGNHPLSQADPFIVKEGGYYYILTSGTGYEEGDPHGVPLYRSKSLFGPYQYLGLVFSLPGEKEYWAPSLLKIDGLFYLYVSTMKEGEEDVHLQTMKVGVAKNIEGPYELLNASLIPPFSIDSHPYQNASGAYLFYAANDYQSEKAGTRIYVDKMIDPGKMQGHPVALILPSHPQEIFQKDRFQKGQDWYTLEGPCYFEEDGYQYLLYSGNNFLSEDYFVGYALAKSSETDIRKISFQKQLEGDHPYRVLFRNESETGTGHNSVVKDGGKWYIVYHGRDDGDSHRTMRIARLHVAKGKLFVEAI